jgi:multidrug resistance efflux pump
LHFIKVYKNVKEFISIEDYEKLEHERNLKRADIKTAEANILYKESVIKKATLKAPFNGKIVEKNIDEGGVLGNGIWAYKLIDNRIKFIIEFDDKYIPLVRVGDTFTYKISGTSIEKSVKITKIYPSVDSKTKRVRAEAYGNGLKVGQFGDGKIRGRL